MPIIIVIMSAVPVLLSTSVNEAKYAVIDHSGWVLAAVQKRFLKNDIHQLLESETVPSLNGSEYTEEFDESVILIEQLRQQFKEGEEKKLFASQAADLLYTLSRENASILQTPTLLEQFADWWHKNPQQVLSIIPNASFSHYQYVEPADTSTARLQILLNAEHLLGYFVIPEDPIASGEGASYVTKNLTNRDLQLWFANAVSSVVQGQRIREESIEPNIADWIQQPIAFETVVLNGEDLAVANASDTLTQWAPVAFVYLLWISIFTITQMLLTNTVEEKSNKLVEILLSSVSARELMAGKILGIAGTGLTIVGSWLIAFLILILGLPSLLDSPLPFDLLSLVDKPLYLASFILYFILGYLFYAAFLCGLGSLCNNLKEAQNLMMPVQLILIVPLLVMIPIGKDPGGTLATVMSWIPPFTPFAMMNRAAMPPGPGTYFFTTLLMIISIYFALRMATRIFETGILMTGKPPKLTQIFRMLKTK
ncbi:MAG: ABC transporter permease [Pseudomonadales bacterium]|nr:ABC transporter permease [Pseudomonadales bacterium]